MSRNANEKEKLAMFHRIEFVMKKFFRFWRTERVKKIRKEITQRKWFIIVVERDKVKIYIVPSLLPMQWSLMRFSPTKKDEISSRH